MLLQRAHKASIKAALRAYFGGVLSSRSVERYVSRARDIIMSELGRGKAFLRALSLLNYEQIVADPNTSARDRIRALARIDKLMGLEEHGPLPPLETILALMPTAMADEFRRALREHLHRPAAAPPAEPPPLANGSGRSRLPLDPDLPPL
jgi:hypothetical protein